MPSAAESAAARTAQQYFREYMGIQAQYEGKVRVSLQNTAKRLFDLLMRMPDESFSEQIRLAQAADRKAQIDVILERGWGVIEGHLSKGAGAASDVAVASLDKYTQLIISGVGQSEVLRQFEEAAREAVRNVQSRVINAIDLSPRVYGNLNLATGAVDEIINKAILSGDSAKELATAALDFILPDVPGGMSYSAMRLARTEINNAFHTTQKDAMDENPTVEGAKWNLSKSHPREDDCDDYADNDDGMGPGVFASDDIPDKPHPQCFCYITAVMMPKGDFIDGLLAGDFDDFVQSVLG